VFAFLVFVCCILFWTSWCFGYMVRVSLVGCLVFGVVFGFLFGCLICNSVGLVFSFLF